MRGPVPDQACFALAARRRRRARRRIPRGRSDPQARSDRAAPRAARHRRRHWSRHLRSDRPGCSESRRTRNYLEFRTCGRRVCFRRTVLCGVRCDAACLGQRLLLFICDPRRADCVVHRLESRARVPVRRLDCCSRLVGILQQLAAVDRRYRRRRARVAGGARVGAAQCRERSNRYDGIPHQSASRRYRCRHCGVVLSGHFPIRIRQFDHRHDQGDGDPAVRRLQRAVCRSGQLAALHSSRGRSRPVRVGWRRARRLDRILRVHRL